MLTELNSVLAEIDRQSSDVPCDGRTPPTLDEYTAAFRILDGTQRRLDAQRAVRVYGEVRAAQRVLYPRTMATSVVNGNYYDDWSNGEVRQTRCNSICV